MRSSLFYSRCNRRRAIGSLAALLGGGVLFAQVIGGGLTVVNSASYDRETPLAPTMLATAFGDFSGVTEATPSGPPPTELGNARVLVAGTPAMLLYTSARQINFVIPSSARPGSAALEIQAGGNRLAGTTVEIAVASPVLFAQSGLVRNANGSANSEASPAGAGETLTFFATGLPAGAEAPNTGAVVGLARVENVAPVRNPNLPGFWTIPIRMPETVSAGRVPLAIYSGGTGSNTLTIWVR